jgi:hypothetical protein
MQGELLDSVSEMEELDAALPKSKFDREPNLRTMAGFLAELLSVHRCDGVFVKEQMRIVAEE